MLLRTFKFYAFSAALENIHLGLILDSNIVFLVLFCSYSLFWGF